MTIKTKRSLGQNFLTDKQILNNSNCAEIKDKDILEVGLAQDILLMRFY